MVRGPGWKSTDLSIMKGFRVTETKRFELRGETFNLTNTPQFSAPVRSASSDTFGEITGAQGDCQIQIAAKIYF